MMAIPIILGLIAVATLLLLVFIWRSEDTHTSMILRYTILYVVMIGLSIIIVFQIINLQYKEYDKLTALQNTRQAAPDTIKAKRGNILSDDGRLMASSVPTYYLYMDMRVEAFKQKDKKTGVTFFESNVDSLALLLSRKFKDRTPDQYAKDLRTAYRKQLSEYRIYPKRVSYTDYLEVKRFPILRRGQIQGGFSTETRVVRVNPFGILAKRTIGDIYGIYEKGGSSGLEKRYNDELKGINGLKTTEKKAGRKTDIILARAQDGKDIVCTINLKLQETAELSLKAELEKDDADFGCAILMEVATGKIKAIANLSRTSNGEYTEVTNIAAGSEIDPGSTFKTMSFMVAMDDGAIDTTTTVNTGDGWCEFAGRKMNDWTVGHRAGFGVIDVPTVMYQSSNVGVSVLIEKHYGNNPQRFIDLIHKTKFDQPIDLEIPGHAKVKIKDTDSRLWSKTSLPWMSIGYEVTVPPIYTLMLYNAIANDGRMVKPMFVSQIKGPGDSVTVMPVTVINDAICKKETLGKMQKILEGVVSKGTAKDVQSKLFKIAGKTGTSQIFEHGSNKDSEGHVRHQITFCGYFPADKPMYSCLVYIREPKHGASAGKMCGKVFKTIAERAYILSGGEIPVWAKDSIKDAMTQEVAMKQERTLHDTNTDKIPDLTGLTASEARYLMEKRGLKVRIRGVGRIAGQSIAPGTEALTAKEITLELR